MEIILVQDPRNTALVELLQTLERRIMVWAFGPVDRVTFFRGSQLALQDASDDFYLLHIQILIN